MSWKVVLKYNFIMLLVFGINSFSMNVVSSFKFFLILLALLAIQCGKKFVLLVNRDKRPLAMDKFSALKMLEILSKKLSNSLILSSLCLMVFFSVRISFSSV